MNLQTIQRPLLFLTLITLLLGACGGVGAPAAPPTASESPATIEPAVTPSAGPDMLLPVSVEAVNVEIGTGSPIPVDAVVSGTWPGLCAQLAEVRQSVSEAHFEISLLANLEDPNCPQDYVGLAFRFAVPLNMTAMPPGSYTVNANGVEASFDWSAGNAKELPPAAITELRPLDVAALNVEIGVGSPIPVEAVVSGDWPDPCAQLAELRQTLTDGRSIGMGSHSRSQPTRLPGNQVRRSRPI